MHWYKFLDCWNRRELFRNNFQIFRLLQPAFSHKGRRNYGEIQQSQIWEVRVAGVEPLFSGRSTPATHLEVAQIWNY